MIQEILERRINLSSFFQGAKQQNGGCAKFLRSFDFENDNLIRIKTKQEEFGKNINIPTKFDYVLSLVSKYKYGDGRKFQVISEK